VGVIVALVFFDGVQRLMQPPREPRVGLLR